MSDDLFRAVFIFAALCAACSMTCMFFALRSLTARIERLEEAVMELNPGIHL